MARGKFNKRGGGPRLDAISAEEIEIRNQRLAELEEQRAQRRAESDEEDEEGEEAAEEEKEGDKKPKKGAPEPDKPAVVTTQAEHNRNMAKLAEVRKRREEAEARRKAEEELEKEQEEEQKRLAAMTLDDGEDDSKKKKKSKEDDIPKLDKVAIKRMKPAQLKDALKARGLDYQGNAKTLLDRLQKYEAAR